MKEEKGGDERGDEWRGRKSVKGTSRDVKGKMCSSGNVIDSKRRNRVREAAGEGGRGRKVRREGRARVGRSGVGVGAETA